MTRYQLSGENYVTKGDLRISTVDTLEYPNTNEHYLDYRKWLAAGNVPDPAPQKQVEVPDVVSRFQGIAALRLAGYIPTIEAIMESSETPQLVKDAWMNVTEFRRYSPMVLSLAEILKLSEIELDKLFIMASEIKA